MESSIWLTSAQVALMRAALLRARDDLRANGGRSRNVLRLALVETALARMHTGSYGECTSCSEPIPFVSLEKRPEQPFCAECERERRRGASDADVFVRLAFRSTRDDTDPPGAA